MLRLGCCHRRAKQTMFLQDSQGQTWTQSQSQALGKTLGSVNTDFLSLKHTYAQETTGYLLWSALATSITLKLLDLSSPAPSRDTPTLSTHHPFFVLLFCLPRLPLTSVQWVVWSRVYVVFCSRQVQTISVFVSVSVWFSILCLWSGF